MHYNLCEVILKFKERFIVTLVDTDFLFVCFVLFVQILFLRVLTIRVINMFLGLCFAEN